MSIRFCSQYVIKTLLNGEEYDGIIKHLSFNDRAPSTYEHWKFQGYVDVHVLHTQKKKEKIYTNDEFIEYVKNRTQVNIDFILYRKYPEMYDYYIQAFILKEKEHFLHEERNFITKYRFLCNFKENNCYE